MATPSTQSRLVRWGVLEPPAEEPESGASAPGGFNLVEAILAASCGLFLAAGLALDALGTPQWIHTGLYLGAYLSGGFVGAVTALRALRQGRLDVNVLMIVAALGAA